MYFNTEISVQHITNLHITNQLQTNQMNFSSDSSTEFE